MTLMRAATRVSNHVRNQLICNVIQNPIPV